MNRPDVDFAALPGVSDDLDGPTFHEPWQAQAFALVVRLAESGAFTWREWTEALAGEIAAAGPDDSGEQYYEHWLAALEKLADAKGLTRASVTPAAMPGSAPPGQRRMARPFCFVPETERIDVASCGVSGAGVPGPWCGGVRGRSPSCCGP